MASNHITIKQAGPYTVTTDGNRVYVNGVQATPKIAPVNSGLDWVLDTGCLGANGKRDLVGLTAAHYQTHKDASAAMRAAEAAAPRTETQVSADIAAARAAAAELAYTGRHAAIVGAQRTGRMTSAA